MTQSEMYEHIRSQLRGTDVKPIEAIAKTLGLCGCQLLLFNKGDEHLYVRCDCIPWHIIDSIKFLANANFLGLKIVAFNRKIELEKEQTTATPYIHIYQK